MFVYSFTALTMVGDRKAIWSVNKSGTSNPQRLVVGRSAGPGLAWSDHWKSKSVK